MSKEKLIEFECNGNKVRCSKQAYIVAKTKDLREFGYPTLTEAQVKIQLEKVIAGKTLNVIGKFIEGDNTKEV
jgi:hypothetical protein